jgi:hypothetical protein
MDKTFTSVVVAAFFVLSTSIAFANSEATAESHGNQKREVAADFSKDYLEQVKDEKAFESTSDANKAKEHLKYLHSMHEHGVR